jgi:hypothetical protein
MISRSRILEIKNDIIVYCGATNEEIKDLCTLALQVQGLVEALEKCRIIKVDGCTYESEVARQALSNYRKAMEIK